MSTHVIPDGERLRHLTTMGCECGPFEQLTIDGDGPAVWAIVHRSIDIVVQHDVVREAEA